MFIILLSEITLKLFKENEQNLSYFVSFCLYYHPDITRWLYPID